MADLQNINDNSNNRDPLTRIKAGIGSRAAPLLVGASGSYVTSGAAAIVTLLALSPRTHLALAPLLVLSPGERHPVLAAPVARLLAPGLPPASVASLRRRAVVAAASFLVGP